MIIAVNDKSMIMINFYRKEQDLFSLFIQRQFSYIILIEKEKICLKLTETNYFMLIHKVAGWHICSAPFSSITRVKIRLLLFKCLKNLQFV